MTNRQMLLCMQFTSGYGAEPGAWRLPGANLSSYTDMDQFVRYAQAAEHGKIQLLFFADTPVLDVDLEHQAPHHPIDPLLVMTSIARETERIGLVATASTTFNEPYTLARQFKALDVISHGRAGWNAVTTSDPAAAANFGRPIPSRTEKYERAHEVVHILQALWGSWEKDAWVRDILGKRFADMDRIRPVNLQGRHIASRGPLPVPPSEQGQPVIFQAGGSSYGLELAGRYADGVYANPYTVEDGQAQRNALRDAAKRAGRDPDDVQMFAGFMPTIAASRRAALDRRRFLDESVDLRQRVRYLGAMIGLPLTYDQIDEPLSASQLADAVPGLHDPRSTRALEVVREGWTLRDVIAHGVIDYHSVVAGCFTWTTKALPCAITSEPASSTGSIRASRNRPGHDRRSDIRHLRPAGVSRRHGHRRLPGRHGHRHGRQTSARHHGQRLRLPVPGTPHGAGVAGQPVASAGDHPPHRPLFGKVVISH